MRALALTRLVAIPAPHPCCRALRRARSRSECGSRAPPWAQSQSCWRPCARTERWAALLRPRCSPPAAGGEACGSKRRRVRCRARSARRHSCAQVTGHPAQPVHPADSGYGAAVRRSRDRRAAQLELPRVNGRFPGRGAEVAARSSTTDTDRARSTRRPTCGGTDARRLAPDVPVVGRRGGLGGVADRVRARLADRART
jgi:hypothetical protein